MPARDGGPRPCECRGTPLGTEGSLHELALRRRASGTERDYVRVGLARCASGAPAGAASPHVPMGPDGDYAAIGNPECMCMKRQARHLLCGRDLKGLPRIGTFVEPPLSLWSLLKVGSWQGAAALAERDRDIDRDRDSDRDSDRGREETEIETEAEIETDKETQKDRETARQRDSVIDKVPESTFVVSCVAEKPERPALHRVANGCG